MVLYCGSNDSLAQPVEHMTFNHGVWSSILQWVTRKKHFVRSAFFVICCSKTDIVSVLIIEETKGFIKACLKVGYMIYLLYEHHRGGKNALILYDGGRAGAAG